MNLPRLLSALKSLALVGIFATAILGQGTLGVVSCLVLVIAQALIMLYIMTATGNILDNASSKELPKGIGAEAITLRRLVLPRAYPAIILAAILFTLLAAPPMFQFAFWPHLSLAIITILAGVYSAIAEFFAFRLLESLQSRVSALLSAL
ncbi:MAG: hypothetical protein HZB43_09570 [candidate division Zixibacteria bacterium]|nr:hypothetical protein [candidate division Zixibacteria bacterium]